MTDHDAKIALRSFLRAPLLSLATVIVLTLGVATHTIVFSVFDAVLLRPLPYPEAERLVLIWETQLEESRPEVGPSPGNMSDWRAASRSFSGIAGWYAEQPVTLDGLPQAQKVLSAWVTTDFFSVLGRPPMLGRTFTEDEVERQEPAVVMSHWLWQGRYSGDPGLIGQSVSIDGVPTRVLGVMPSDFAMPTAEVGLYTPWNFERGYENLPSVPRDYRFLRVMGRLRPKISLAQAQSDLESIALGLAETYPTTNLGWSVRVVPFKDSVVGDVRPALLLLFGATFAILMICCATVANLQLARGVARRRELALRAALGASRARIVGQLLTEGAAPAMVSGVLGIGLASLGIELLVRLSPAELPRVGEASIDARAAVFALGVSLLASVVSGLLPALRGSRTDPGPELAGSGRAATPSQSTRRWQDLLVTFEIAAACALLVAAVELGRSFSNLVSSDPGFGIDRQLVLRAFPDDEKYDTGERRRAYFDELRERLLALPGVTAVGAATGLPMNPYNNTPSLRYWPEDEPASQNAGRELEAAPATVGFFRAMEMRLLAGRTFSERDGPESPRVVVVNQELARRAFRGQDPLGRRLVIEWGSRLGTYEVVGVVADVRNESLRQGAEPQAWAPHAQITYVTMNVVVRMAGDPLALEAAARRVALEIDPTQPLHSVTTMHELVGKSLARDRFAAWLFAAIGCLAGLLAVAGVFSVVSYAVTLRTREIGIRVAVGAHRRDVLALVMRHATTLAALGLAAGWVTSTSLGRVTASLLYGLDPGDVSSWSVAALILTGGVLAASYLPARQALSVDPVRALRRE